MNRRKFIRNSSVTGLGMGVVTMVSCDSTSPTTATSKEAMPGKAFKDEFILNEITMEDLQAQMAGGKTTSAEITGLYLKRIEAIDKSGPAINAVIEVNPDAMAIASQLDNERKNGKIRGPMHGIPVLIKDNIDTADKMMTTAGSLALAGNMAAKDAFVVTQLRNAGAVILGKTNLSEWANFRSTRSSSGWSSRGGQTKNPCVLDRNPSGSSSGSGAAVAANLCTVAIGTETDGSVIAPASCNGIVGIKPTVGLVSRTGIIPISATQDTAGPMARTIWDAAILLGVMSGIDEADKTTLNSSGKAQKDYTQFLDIHALTGKKIGIEKSFLKGHEAVVALYQQAIALLSSKGATIIEIELRKRTSELGDDEYEVLKYEFKDGVNRYLATASAPVKTLEDVIHFNKQNEDRVMPWFKQEILESCQEKEGLESIAYKKALAGSLGAANIIDGLMGEYGLDAICGTSIGIPGCIDLINGDYDTGFYFCPPAAMAGYPHITVPMGSVSGLPVGLSFMGKAYGEPGLLAIAFAYEQASKHRKPPAFKSTFGI